MFWGSIVGSIVIVRIILVGGGAGVIIVGPIVISLIIAGMNNVQWPMVISTFAEKAHSMNRWSGIASNKNKQI